jgi:ketosteroid isomerase-like protein
MSQENVEIVREARDASNARDAVAFVACLSPDVEWEESGDVLPGLRGVYRGRAEVQGWFEEAVIDPWESFRFKEEREEIRETSDGRVFAEMVASARGRASGV